MKIVATFLINDLDVEKGITQEVLDAIDDATSNAVLDTLRKNNIKPQGDAELYTRTGYFHDDQRVITINSDIEAKAHIRDPLNPIKKIWRYIKRRGDDFYHPEDPNYLKWFDQLSNKPSQLLGK